MIDIPVGSQTCVFLPLYLPYKGLTSKRNILSLLISIIILFNDTALTYLVLTYLALLLGGQFMVEKESHYSNIFE